MPEWLYWIDLSSVARDVYTLAAIRADYDVSRDGYRRNAFLTRHDFAKRIRAGSKGAVCVACGVRHASLSTVDRAIAELEDAGVLRVERDRMTKSKAQTCNRYAVRYTQPAGITDPYLEEATGEEWGEHDEAALADVLDQAAPVQPPGRVHALGGPHTCSPSDRSALPRSTTPLRPSAVARPPARETAATTDEDGVVADGRTEGDCIEGKSVPLDLAALLDRLGGNPLDARDLAVVIEAWSSHRLAVEAIATDAIAKRDAPMAAFRTRIVRDRWHEQPRWQAAGRTSRRPGDAGAERFVQKARAFREGSSALWQLSPPSSADAPNDVSVIAVERADKWRADELVLDLDSDEDGLRADLDELLAEALPDAALRSTVAGIAMRRPDDGWPYGTRVAAIAALLKGVRDA